MTELVPLPGAPTSTVASRSAPREFRLLRSTEFLALALVLVDLCAVALLVLFLAHQPRFVQRIESLPLLAWMPETGASMPPATPVFAGAPVALTASPTLHALEQHQPGATPSAVPVQPSPTHVPTTASEIVSPQPTLSPVEIVPTATPPSPTLPLPTPTPAPALDSPAPQSAPARIPANSPPTRITIPSIGVDVPVRPVGPVTVVRNGKEKLIWDTRPDVACFHETSALPGRPGNTVINGHRDVGAAVFRMLDKVQIGDEIDVFVDDAAYVYHVTEVLVVAHTFASPEQRAENQRLIGFIPEERLTLITCTPIGSTTHRLLVIAKPHAADG